MSRGAGRVFAGDKSDFQKIIIRQAVQADAVLSHLLLPPREYNPGPVPRPLGHLRAMKSSQLPLQPASKAGNRLAGGPSPAGRKRALPATPAPPARM